MNTGSTANAAVTRTLKGCIPFLKIRSASILLAYNTREQDAHTTDRLSAKLGCSPLKASAGGWECKPRLVIHLRLL